MTQKLLKIGASAAVTIPKKSLKELGLKIGDSVMLSIDPRAKKVVIQPAIKIDRELMQWTKKFTAKYHSALTALAQK